MNPSSILPTRTRVPVLCIYEQIMAMKQAAEIAGLSQDDIEGIFWRNAHEALQIDPADENTAAQ